MEEFKNKTKQYQIIELSLPDGYLKSGVTIYDLCGSYRFDGLLNEDEINYLKNKYSYLELIKKNFFSLGELISFYCTTFGYSIVSVQKTADYRFLITLIKD